MILALPFKIWTGCTADAFSLRPYCNQASSPVADPARVRGIQMRSFDRQMPDVPPTAGSADVNIGIAVYRVSVFDWIPDFDAAELGSTYNLSVVPGHGMYENRGLRIYIGRGVEQWAKGDDFSSLAPIFSFGFNARKGFAKYWTRERAFCVGWNEILLVTLTPRSTLPGGAVESRTSPGGLILHGTMELSD